MKTEQSKTIKTNASKITKRTLSKEAHTLAVLFETVASANGAICEVTTSWRRRTKAEQLAWLAIAAAFHAK